MLLHFSGILVFGNENFLTCLLHTVNSYFRDVFTNQWNDAVLDFEPPRTLFGPPQTGSHQPDSAELPSMPDSAVSGTLDNFPCSVLEEIFIHLDAWSLCQTSKVNKIFKKVNCNQ